MKINKYATTLTTQVDKNKLMDDGEFTRQAIGIVGESIRSLNESEQSFSKSKVRLPKEVIQSIAKPVKDGIKSDVGRTARTIGGTLSLHHGKIAESFEYLIDYVDKNFNEHIIPTGATVRDVNVLAALDLVSVYTDYVGDMASAIMYGYASNVGKKRKYTPPDYIIGNLEVKRKSFIHAMTVLAGGGAVLEKVINSLPEIVVDSSNEDMMSTAHASSVMASPLFGINGFNGNPILYLLNLTTDVQVWHIKGLREKKTQLEILRLIVETEVEQGGSPAAQRELQSIEERINKIASKLDYWEEE